MGRAVLCVVLLAGCGFTASPSSPGGDSPMHDAPRTIDAPGTVADVFVPPIDAADPGTCNSALCALAGGACSSNVCVIAEGGSGVVTCPSGMPCKVNCTGSNACQNGVYCAGATVCEVACFGSGACSSFGVDCGDAYQCSVLCDGSNACQHGISDSVKCRDATCNVVCKGNGSCADGISANGACAAHCCDNACSGGVGTCTRDAVCP